jgi:NADPH:quinone reductase-like Zn-dependent oxidoreductase
MRIEENLMKAAVYRRYGLAKDVLNVRQVDKPNPRDDEVLIRVQSASVNAYDWHLLRADPFFTRAISGILRPHNPILGADIAGVVESVGSAVTQWKPGDEVYGCLESQGIGGLAVGGFAEYVCAKESLVVTKPSTISFDEAAALPMAAVTALQGLKRDGKLEAGQKILINGASGGVGTYAVQIAKALGAEVDAACSAGATEMVRSLGADCVFDYAHVDFAKSGKRYDLILDIAANRFVSEYRQALSPDGVCVVVGYSGILPMLNVAMLGGKRIGILMADNTSQDDLWYLNELINARSIRSVIDSCYPLANIASALHHAQTGHPKGKIIVAVTQ